ncbi:hypothetical protein VTJ83DRAFT_5203 [Remersonia thermophila]|uniref:Mitochondrial outer membrane protein OM14 C-terminal domain-containing protein n=1 Tax=Remersonia thermophila TaxID=72144 RepID=A0ABR4DC57_9PEZI
MATTATSTGSLVDVDLPSVHTVASDFAEQTIKTQTQADRIQREAEAHLKELRETQEREAAQAIDEAKKQREAEEESEEEEEESEESAEAAAQPSAKSKKAKRKEKKKEKKRKQAAAAAKSKAESAAAAGASGARRLDAWLAHRLLDPVVNRSAAASGTAPAAPPAEGGDYAPATGALALTNAVAVVALSGWLGFRAWGLYDRGRLGPREAGIGLGILGVVGAFQGVFVKWAAGRFASAPPARG